MFPEPTATGQQARVKICIHICPQHPKQEQKQQQQQQVRAIIMEGLDTDFISTRYGILRVAHFALCIICLILNGISNCYSRDYRLFEWVSSYGLIFSILVLIMFCVRFHHAIENYVNLPLSLMVNEIILAVLFILAGISVLTSLCPGAARIGGIFAGIFGIITGVTFGAAARLSYDWFATGTPDTTM